MKTLLLSGNIPVFLSGLQQIVHAAHPSYRILRCPLQRQRLQVMLRDQKIDYLIVDLSEEPQPPAWLGAAIKQAHPLRVLAFGKWEEPVLIRQLISLPVSAYLPLASTGSTILEALKKLQEDDVYLPDTLRRRLADLSLGIGKLTRYAKRITPREKQVLRLIVDEYTTREIAELLFISTCTAETHRLNLINKFGVKNTAGLVREAVRNEIVGG